MPIFKVKAEMTVTYVYEVDADTFEDAIFQVEDGLADNCVEIDSSMPRAIEIDAACENCGNTLNDGSDVCDQCGGTFK